MDDGDIEEALRIACRAAAVCVTRPGAADSIPKREELLSGGHINEIS